MIQNLNSFLETKKKSFEFLNFWVEMNEGECPCQQKEKQTKQGRWWEKIAKMWRDLHHSEKIRIFFFFLYLNLGEKKQSENIVHFFFLVALWSRTNWHPWLFSVVRQGDAVDSKVHITQRKKKEERKFFPRCNNKKKSLKAVQQLRRGESVRVLL